GRLGLQPHPLGQPSRDQGDLRPAHRLALPAHGLTWPPAPAPRTGGGPCTAPVVALRARFAIGTAAPRPTAPSPPPDAPLTQAPGPARPLAWRWCGTAGG